MSTPIAVLTAALEAKKWDDRRLARETGIYLSSIRRYLKEKVRIGLKNGPKIARALNIPFESIISTEEAA